MARVQIDSKLFSLSDGFIPAKKSRSMARMTFIDPGCQSRKPFMSQLSQRSENDPDDLGSTSSLPSSDSIASVVLDSSSLPESSGAASHSTRSTGRGISGSIQLKAWMRPFARQFSTRDSRSFSEDTRRSSSRISSDLSTADASEWASIRTSACGSSKSKFRVIQPAVSA